MRWFAYLMFILLAQLAASAAAAWTVKTGTDDHSGTKYAIASQSANGSDEVLGIECQYGKDLMVGLALDMKVGDSTLFLKYDYLEFTIPGTKPVRVPVDPERTENGNLIYTIRRSDNPSKIDELIGYLIYTLGDVYVGLIRDNGRPSSFFLFPDKDRRENIEAVLSFCNAFPGVDAATTGLGREPEPSTLPDKLVASDFGMKDLPRIHKTYGDNQARFVRDYRSRTFGASMTVLGIREATFERGQFHVALGENNSIDVMCNSLAPDAMKVVYSLNKGDMVYVKGIIDDHTFGMLILQECSILTNSISKPFANFNTLVEGVWAKDRKACELYQSGEFEKPQYDTATLSRFGVSEFRNGNFEMLASPVRCKVAQNGAPDKGKYNISAQCQVKDYPTRPATGSVVFRPSGDANLELHGTDFGLIKLIKCDRK